jgi:hypothetical protein
MKIQGHPNLITAKEVIMNGKLIDENDPQSPPQQVFAIMILETLKGGELYF